MLFVTLALVMVGCTESSTDDNGTDPENNQVSQGDASVKVLTSSTPESGYEASSLNFAFDVSGVESYTYVMHKGGTSVESEAVIVYAEAESIYDITSDGELSTTIYGLEGETLYTGEFVFKIAGEENYISMLVDVTTGDYSRLINVISVDAYRVKFQVNFPEDKYYKLLFYNKTDYEASKYSYDITDVAEFGFVGSDKIYFGANIHEMNDGGTVVNSRYGDFTYSIKPAMSFVVMVAECDADGNIYYGDTYPDDATTSAIAATASKSSSRPNIGDYSEICNDTQDAITGLYARQYVTTILPVAAEGDVEIIQKITERSATFTFVPSDEVVQYGYTFASGDQTTAFEQMPEGEEKEIYLTSLMSDMTAYYDATQDGLINLAADDVFTLFIIYQSDKEGFTRSAKAISFSPIVSTLPVIELEITPAEVSDGSPYMVAFNIKAPNKDCQSVTYLCAYTSEWEQLIYSDSYAGYDLEAIKDAMLTSYGTDLTTSIYTSFFAGVNSDEGYHMEFPSWENRETTLVMATFNEEEKINIVSCASWSAEEPAADIYIESELFETLLGDWTGSIDKFQVGWELSNSTPTYYSATFDASIINDPGYDAPDVFNSSHVSYNGVLNHYVTLAKEADPTLTTIEAYTIAQAELEALFVEFKETAARYKQKYREHNRLCLSGFGVIPDYINYGYSAWELFINLNYSAWNIETMFYEYGPKMFLGIKQDNSVVLETNTQYIAPFMATTSLNYQIAAISKTADTSLVDQEFPVTITDADNFSFEPVSYGGYDDFYISTSYYRFGDLYASVLASSPIKYTRNSAAATAQKVVAVPTASENAQMSEALKSANSGGNVYRRPYLPKVPFMMSAIRDSKIDITNYVSTDIYEAVAEKNNSILIERINKGNY